MSDSSDDEQVSELRDWTTTDFWLGKKYFELSLLRCIIKDHACCGPTTLESHLHERLRKYPYSQNLRYLQIQLPRNLWCDTEAEYRDLVVTIGRVQRLGTTREKTRLKQSLSHFGGNPALDILSETEINRPSTSPPTLSSPLHPGTSTQRPRNGARTPQPGRATDETASPMHVVALEEYGASIGESPNYTYRRRPAIAETTMTFRGRTLESSAKTVKEAKQQVAKAACVEFGLHVPSV